MSLNRTKNLTYSTPDKTGYFPGPTGDKDMIGTFWLHQNGDLYVVRDIVFDASADEWAFEYVKYGEANPVKFVRINSNFFGERNGSKRFVKVNNPPQQYAVRGSDLNFDLNTKPSAGPVIKRGPIDLPDLKRRGGGYPEEFGAHR